MNKNYFILTLVGILLFNSPESGIAQDKASVGEWSEVIPFGIVPVAVANLPDGNLITWSSKSKTNFFGADGLTYYELFNPFLGPDGTALGEQQTTTNHDMFCPGINNLDDGRLLVTGGSSSEKSTIYDYRNNSWQAAEDMFVPRGYQGSVTLSDGSAFVIGGSWSGGIFDKLAEIWTEEEGWRELPNLPGDAIYNQNDSNLEPEGLYRLDNHTWLWPAPNGKLFHAGPSEDMHWIDTQGNGEITFAGKRADDTYAMKGTTVMFDIGKILKVAGATSYNSRTPAKDNSYVIDINDENNVTVTSTVNNLSFSRTMHNSTVLPNGEVLVTGGLSRAIAFSDDGARLTAEMYSPETNSWRNVAGMREARTYHSVAILMTDGRVFAGGGGLCGGCGINHLNAEIYSPSYLFNPDGSLATRPVISAPDAVAYNSPLAVTSNEAIEEFVFIRMSSATHSTNNEQRRIPLSFQNTGNGNYTINVPGSNLLPPGYYMLFAMNNQGVPSVSEVIRVGENSITQVQGPNIPLGNVAYRKPTAQSSTFQATSARAVDGITNGEFLRNSVAHTQEDATPWWRVDLGAQYDISEIRIFNRTDCCADRLDNFKVYIGNIESSNPSDYIEVGDLSAEIEQSFTQNLSTGRYVMVRSDNPTFLHIAEVQVFGSLTNQTTNIALNKVATQSSTITGFGGNSEASSAVDGIRDGGFTDGSVSHTGFDENAWWRVDLGAQYNVQNINVFNRTDCCANRLETGKVYVGNIDSVNPDDYVQVGTLGADAAFDFNDINVEGRYVMVRLDATDFLQLAEVEVFGEEVQAPSDENIALNKVASQSSSIVGFGGNPVASSAVDGNRDGNFEAGSVSHTELEENAWWRVDLGTKYNLESINVFNRTDCCGGRLATGKLYVGNVDSSDPGDYIQVANLGADETYTFNNINVEGRYVMVRLDGTDFLQLAEIEVFGEEVQAPVAQNLALNKTTSQSSVLTGFGSSPESSSAVDGTRGGDYYVDGVAHTQFDQNAWWRVDLDSKYNVESINVYNRTDCCAGRLETGKVYVGNVDSVDPVDYVQVGDLGADATFNINNINIEGRYVMVRLDGSNFLQLAEVEVYGSTGPSQNIVAQEKSESLKYKEEAFSDGIFDINEVKIYPNPSNGLFSVNLATEEVSGALRMSIYNSSGQEVYNKNYNLNYIAVEDINLRHLPTGVYILKLFSEAGPITKRIIIRN